MIWGVLSRDPKQNKNLSLKIILKNNNIIIYNFQKIKNIYTRCP
jgi:hypothetical protein